MDNLFAISCLLFCIGSNNVSIDIIVKPDLPVLTIIQVHQVQNTSVILRWSKPADNGGKITQYTLYQKEDGLNEEWKQISHIYGDAREKLLENLEPGRRYSFVVTATNKFGDSSIDDGADLTVEIPAQTPPPTGTNLLEPI